MLHFVYEDFLHMLFRYLILNRPLESFDLFHFDLHSQFEYCFYLSHFHYYHYFDLFHYLYCLKLNNLLLVYMEGVYVKIYFDFFLMIKIFLFDVVKILLVLN